MSRIFINPTFGTGSLTLPTTFLKFWWGFIYLLALMNLWRLVFLLSQYNYLDYTNWQLYIASFFIGLRLDAVVASYLLLPMAGLIILKMIGPGSRIYDNISLSYFFLITLIISFINVVDVFFFQEFNNHINLLMVKSYIAQKESMEFILEEYPIALALFVVLIITGTVFYVYRKVSNSIKERPSFLFSKIAGALLSVIILGTTARGGWQERPIDWGHAMFSHDFIANQTALNSIFIFGRSVIQFTSEKNMVEMIDFYDTEEALNVTREILDTPNTQFLDETSIIRRNRANSDTRYNVILVILESHAGAFCGYINGEDIPATPNLDRMAHQGIAFTNCYANGKRSAHGIGSILMSWPNLPGLPLISRVESVRDVPSLGTTLTDIGYKTVFLYGGDSQFDNMKGFMTANGFDKVIERKDFSSKAKGTKWGIFDHYVFHRALEEIDHSEKPVFLTLFTTTNHQPWEIPSDHETLIPYFPDQPYRNGAVHHSMAYTDYVLGKFMESAALRDWYDNSIFVFIADHGLSIFKDQLEDIRNANIPFVIYAPGLSLTPQIINRPVSQADVAPTILGLIEYTGPYNFFGQNALSTDSTFACRVVGDRAFWLEDDYLYTELFGQSTVLYRVTYPIEASSEIIDRSSPLHDYYQRRFRSYIQTAYTQFKTFGTHNGN